MSAIPPGALVNWLEQRFAKVQATGTLAGALVPNAGGYVECYELDGVTPKLTYSDPDLTVPNTAIVTLGSDGRPASDMYLDRGGYQMVVYDIDDNLLYTDICEDTAGTYWSDFGSEQASGSEDVADGYQVLETDNLVTTDATVVGTPNLTLDQAANRVGLPLVIKNQAAVAWTVTPFGSDTIDKESAGTAITLPAASSGSCPAITLVPKSGGWFITATAFI